LLKRINPQKENLILCPTKQSNYNS